MMRYLYTGLFYLLLPIIFLRLLWRGFKAPDYWLRWNERLGFYTSTSVPEVIWFHAVSVGEAESVFQLVKMVQQAYPNDRVLITTTTPTGSARVTAVMADKVEHVYLPYDIPGPLIRFMKHFQPKIAVIMETEIWPNLFCQCGKQNIPLLIINARLSEKSERGYGKLPAFISSVLANVKTIATQTKIDQERFVKIGAIGGRVTTVGNMKFDLDIPVAETDQGKQLKAKLFNGRLVWIIASTHMGEEESFLQIYRNIKKQFPSLLLLIVPRHPERFVKVKNLCEKSQLRVARRSLQQSCSSQTDVYLADTMGELKMLYAASDVAFVGGSLVPVGGHNVLEPAVLGVPVMFGPYMSNFKEIEQGLLDSGAAIKCIDVADIEKKISELLVNGQVREKMSKQGKDFVQKNRGAINKIYGVIDGLLGSI
jgi:3-deoxy-D-manno-octulosonic-acid transferase